MRALFFILGLFAALTAPATAFAATMDLEVDWPRRRLWVGAADVEGITLRAVDNAGAPAPVDGVVGLTGIGVQGEVRMVGGTVALPPAHIEAEQVVFEVAGLRRAVDVPQIQPWLSLLPACLAIGLALISRQVLLALFGGIYTGALLLGSNPLQAFASVFDVMVSSAADLDHTKIMMFTLIMGGMVGIISASGGADGIVASLIRYAKTPRSASLASWGMGMVVFFDDYASTLLVGNTMRPITDGLRISREKLAYIVDSTAAPIASLAVVSTWIGYEVSVLADAMASAGIERDGYEVFISGLPSRFYQILALVFVAMIAIMGRDFGPMLTAERRARRGDGVLRKDAKPLMDANLLESGGDTPLPRAWLAFGPIAVLVFVALTVMIVTGMQGAVTDPAGWIEAKEKGVLRVVGFVLGNSASYDALVYGAGAGATAAIVFAAAVGALKVGPSLDAFVRGIQATVMAVMVLILAWSIGSVMDSLHAGAFVSGALSGTLPLWTLPSLAFVLAALIAAATGSSWATMAVLFPIVIPLVAASLGDPNFEAVFLATASAILGGAVFGDHCSPISDTTVLSSIACASDHVDHTKTQAPYALTIGAVTIALGYIPAGFGVSPWISIVAGLAALWAILRFLGRSPEPEVETPAAPTKKTIPVEA